MTEVAGKKRKRTGRGRQRTLAWEVCTLGIAEAVVYLLLGPGWAAVEC